MSLRACTYVGPKSDRRPVACVSRTLLTCCLAFLAALTLALAAPVPALAAEATASLAVSQDYSSDSTGVDKTFTYVLEAVTPGAPLPAGGSSGVYTFTMTKDDEFTLVVPFESPLDQEYDYRLYQKVKQKKDGFTYDDTVYTVRLLFAGQEEDYGVLLAYDAEGLKVSKVNWSVTYVSPPSPPKPPTPTPPTPTRPRWLPKTGDLGPSPAVIATIAGCAVALIVAGLIMRGKKRGDE